MKIYWLFNGQPVSTTNSMVANVVVPLVGTVSTLTLADVSPASEGNYSVKVVNGVGSVTSSNAALIVLSDVASGAVNIVSTGTGMTTDGFRIQLSGPAGSNYVIQASSDLITWIPIATNAAPSGAVSFTDTAAKNFAFRYYRATVQ